MEIVCLIKEKNVIMPSTETATLNAKLSDVGTKESIDPANNANLPTHQHVIVSVRVFDLLELDKLAEMRFLMLEKIVTIRGHKMLAFAIVIALFAVVEMEESIAPQNNVSLQILKDVIQTVKLEDFVEMVL